MKKSIFNILVFVIISCILSICFFNCKKANDSLTIGFYSTTDVVEESLKDLIIHYFANTETKLNFVKISSIDTENQIKKEKVDCIVTCAGTSLRDSLKYVHNDAGVPSEITNQMFSTMKQSAVIQNQKVVAVPLCIDNFEIDIDTQSFFDSGMTSLNTWEDINKYTKTQKKTIEYPVIFSTDDAVLFLDFIGALGESLAGYDAYQKAVEILNNPENLKGGFKPQSIADQLFWAENAPFSSVYTFLRKMSDDKMVHPGVKDFSNRDVDILVQDRRARVVFTSLSNHRLLNPTGISRYSSIYIPSSTPANGRHFTANVTYILPISNNQKMQGMIENLVSTDVQTTFTRKTGLAPVLANCRTPDKQASDVRYWIAATSSPLPGLGHETPYTKEQLITLKNEIVGMFF